MERGRYNPSKLISQTLSQFKITARPGGGGTGETFPMAWLSAMIASLPLTTGWALAADEIQADRQATYERYLEFGQLVEGGFVSPRWMDDGSAFWYVTGDSDNTVVFRVEASTGEKTELFQTPRLRQALREKLGEEPPGRGLPFSEFALLEGESAVRFEVDARVFELDLDTYDLRESPPSGDQSQKPTPEVVGTDRFGFDLLEMPSPDGQWLAHLGDHDLWLRSAADERMIRLTEDGVEGFEWGEPFEWDPVLGRPWAWWSPDSTKLAIRKVEDRQLPRIPLVLYGEGTTVEWLPFARAGDPLYRRELYIVDVPDGRRTRVQVETFEGDQISILRWRPDGSELLFMVMDRAHKRLTLMAANADTGAVRTILTETQETFIPPLWAEPPGFMLLGDGSRFLWTSERDGWRHLYLYDLNGDLLGRLTRGSFPVESLLAVDEAKGWVYLTAHADRERPYDTHLYRVRLDGAEFTQLTSGEGQHSVQLSPSLASFVDTYSSVENRWVSELRAVDGTLVKTLAKANIDALRSLGWARPKEFVATATDGTTDLHGVLYRPRDLDAAGKYPVIEYIYDALQTNLVPRIFSPRPGYPSADDWFPLDQIDPRALAELGFVVVVMDARGTAGRGKVFQDVGYAGRHDYIAEHVAALRQLASSRPYMDLDRVGIFGISAGGGKVLEAMLAAPDVYDVGVAIAPGVCIRDLHAEGIEPFYGVVEEDPRAYESCPVLEGAGGLQGKLLLMHGTSDRIVPLSQSMKMVEALVQANRPHDLLILPGQGHLFQGQGARHARSALVRYFVEHLKP